jgi:hypothetical protein
MSSVPWPRVPGAAITEVAGSHVIIISQPQAVTDVILTALTAVGRTGGQLNEDLLTFLRA